VRRGGGGGGGGRRVRRLKSLKFGGGEGWRVTVGEGDFGKKGKRMLK